MFIMPTTTDEIELLGETRKYIIEKDPEVRVKEVVDYCVPGNNFMVTDLRRDLLIALECVRQFVGGQVSMVFAEMKVDEILADISNVFDESAVDLLVDKVDTSSMKQPKQSSGPTKADLARAMVTEMKDAPSKEIIARFVSELGLSKVVARTYLFNARKFLAK